VLQLIELFSEKYLKKLIGTTDIEDALKRLDRLTQEEARMAAAQVLKVANAVDDRVQGIADNVLSVDNKVAGIDDRVADVGDRLKDVNDQVKDVYDQVTGVDDRVKDVNDQVKGVNDRVKAVDDKIAAVADGAQCIFNQLSENQLNNRSCRWKRGQVRHATSSR
jgi:methyl-accepting chemotaxis protein